MLAAACLLGPRILAAADLTVYAEGFQNGFHGTWSWEQNGGDIDFAAAAPSPGHGATSIYFLPNGWSGVSLRRETWDTATYPTLELYVHGGAAGGQLIQVFLQGDGGGTLGNSLNLESYLDAAAVPAGGWAKATIPFSAFGYGGAFTRVNVMGRLETQAAFYLDDVVLKEPAGPPPGGGLLQVSRDVLVGPVEATRKVSDRFAWVDSAGRTRSAAIAQNYGGAMREMTYVVPEDGTTRTCGATTYGNGNNAGFGYVVSHRAEGSAGVGFDNSHLGYAFAGTFTRVFEGANHAIFRFTQSYPRHSTTTANPPNTQYQVPVTIEWTFAVGRDHPLWSVTWDLSAVPANALDDDSRAPYGELNIDGTGTASISGVAWGDRYRFSSTTAPVTLNSAWNWEPANTVPWVKLWLAAPQDATMGLVQTQTLAQHDAGAGRNPWYHDLRPHWGTTSVAGNAGGAYRMPWQDSWPYQANAFSLGTATASNNARLTWGTMYGFLGQQSYATENGLTANAAGWPRQSYSTWVVLGTHSSSPVEAVVEQVETVQTLTLAATVGSVATSGPAGVADPTVATYAPPGWDPTRGALTFVAAGNALDVNLGVAAGRTLRNPLLIVRSFTGEAVPAIRLGGATLVANVDFYASVRDAADELWITLDRDLTGATNRLEIGAGGGGGGGVVTVAADPLAGRRAIDPRVYGVNFGSFGPAVPPYPLRRWGGNATSRYNWTTDVSNHGGDWFFINYDEWSFVEDPPARAALPDGTSVNLFVDRSRAAGADVLLTVPTIGWRPLDALDPDEAGVRRWSFDTVDYAAQGAQTATECTATNNAPWCQPRAGNGRLQDEPRIWVVNDPTDVSQPSGTQFARDWLDYLGNRYGTAAAGGVRLFALDNEMMLWHDTHPDVRWTSTLPHTALPPPTYDELWANTLAFATAIKAEDPAAQVFGPVTWGWCDVFWSAFDNCRPGDDRAAHAGDLTNEGEAMPDDLLPWYLAKVREHQEDTGVRLVDWIDLHYYPQVNGVGLSSGESATVAANRLASLKSLYDPTYKEPSWIGIDNDTAVWFLPRIRAWRDTQLPGARIAITEYNWGDGDADGVLDENGRSHMDGMSSALAQAEVLAIFGREGVDAATRWGPPRPGSLIEDAFRMYLDWDTTAVAGMPRIDGESAQAVSSNVDRVGSYLVVGTGDDAGRLFLLLFNKSTTAENGVTVTFPPGTLTGAAAATYRLQANGYVQVANTVPVGQTVTLDLPARTGTLVVLPIPVPAAALELHTLTPCRLLDTRNPPGDYGGPALAAATTRTFALAGRCGVPATARALALNVTVTQGTGRGYVTGWAADGSRPNTSVIHFSAGQTRASFAVLPLSADAARRLSLWPSVDPGGSVHLIVDVNGWFE